MDEVEIPNKVKKPYMLLAAWTSMMLLAVFMLVLEESLFELESQPIAQVTQIQRDVSIKSESDVSWRQIYVTQDFYDGDRIATGPNSTATLDFGEGKKGVLGPDSIVSVTSIRQQSGKSFILNLIKGGVKPIVPDRSKSQLIVTSGLSTFYVEPGEKRGFAKPVGGTVKQFNQRERFPVQERAQVAASTLRVSLKEIDTQKIEFLQPIVVTEKIPTKFADTPLRALPPIESPRVASKSGVTSKDSYVDPTIDKVSDSYWRKNEAKAAKQESLLSGLKKSIGQVIDSKGSQESNPLDFKEARSIRGSSPSGQQLAGSSGLKDGSKEADKNNEEENLAETVSDPFFAGSSPQESAAKSPEKVSGGGPEKTPGTQLSANGLRAKLAPPQSTGTSSSGTPVSSSSNVASTTKPGTQLAQEQAIAQPKPQPKPEPKPLAPSEILPVVDVSPLQPAYFAFTRLDYFQTKVIPLRVQPPFNASATWTGGIEIDAAGKKSKLSSQGGSVNLTLSADLIRGSRRVSYEGASCVDLVIRPYGSIRASGGRKAQEVLGSNLATIKLCSYAETEQILPARISFNGLTRGQIDGELLTKPTPAANYPYAVVVNQQEDYMKLLPFLRGGMNFRVERGASFGAKGVFGIRDGSVVIEYLAKASEPNISNKIRELLDHSVVFRGDAASIYSTKGMTIEDFKAYVSSKADAGKAVFIQVKGSMIPISRNFMNERKEVADFIKSTSGTIYLNKVEILSYK